MVAGLTACGGGSKDAATDAPAAEETKDDAAEKTTDDAQRQLTQATCLSKSFQGLQHQYWQAVKKGVEQKAAELGVTVNFVGPDSESNISQQVQQLESALNANPTAVGLAALDTESVKDLLQKAMDSKIPVIGFDSGVPGAPEGSVLANCSTDNYAAGALAAEKVYEAVRIR